MHDLLKQLVAYIRSMWRYRWHALAVSWVLCLIGFAWVYSLPNQYESRTRVYVDTDSALRPLLRGLASESNVMNQVTLMTRALLSRPHLEKVARETDLDLRADTPQEMDKLIDRLANTIQIGRGRGDNLYTIIFVDRDPQTAHNVVQTLLGNFVSDTLISKRAEETNARRFLEEQIAAHESRLAKDEQALADFKKENVGLMPGAAGGYYDRLQSAMDQLKATQSAYNLAIQSRNELRKQIAGEEPVFGIVGPAASGQGSMPDDARIEGLKDRLADLMLQYTDKHPDVIALKETIATLEAQQIDDASSSGANSAGPAFQDINPLDLNPVYQNLRISLSKAEVEVTQLRVGLQQQQQSVESLRRAVDTVPEVEAQLSRLNRTYDVTKERYEVLLERLESARMGDQATESSDDIQFRVIDPPTMPLEPIGPNRPMFLTATLFGALLAGLAFSFVLSQISPVFSSRRELAGITGLPVLGEVSVIMMPREKFVRRMQTSAFAIGLAFLVMTYTGAIVFQGPAVRFVLALQNGMLS